jgi:hypothetical protein
LRVVIYYWLEKPPPLRVRLMRSLRRRLQRFFRIFCKRGIDVAALIG